MRKLFLPQVLDLKLLSKSLCARTVFCPAIDHEGHRFLPLCAARELGACRAPARWPATAARQRPWPSVRELLLLHHHKPGGHHRTRRRTTSLDRSHTMEMYIHETHIRCVAPRRNFCLCGSLAGGCGNQRSGAGDISSNGNSVTRWRAGARTTLGCGGPTATARPSFQRRALRPPHGCPLA